MVTRGLGTWILGILSASGCAKGETEDSAATFATYPPMTSPAMTTADTADTGDSDGSDASTSAGDDGSAATADPSSSDGAGTSDGTSAATDTGPAVPPQPADGMYSDCLTAAECVGLNTCITILDTEEMPFDGFCSNNACTDPATDCDPTPGGTTVPFCMMVMLNGNEDTACALDCSGGKTCPGGMMCWELGRTSVCA